MREAQTYPPPSKERELLSFSRKPGNLLLVIAVTIFVSELFVMIILEFMPLEPLYQEALFDAVLLTIIVFPTLYFLVFKPLTVHIVRRQQAEEGKNALIIELNEALAEVRKLQGLLPICSSCKKIRDDTGVWNKMEAYISAHSDVEFSHTYCHDCIRKLFPEEAEEVIAEIDSKID